MSKKTWEIKSINHAILKEQNCGNVCMPILPITLTIIKRSMKKAMAISDFVAGTRNLCILGIWVIYEFNRNIDCKKAI